MISKLAILYLIISIVMMVSDLIIAYRSFCERKRYSHVLCVASITAFAVQLAYLFSIFNKTYREVSILTSVSFILVDFTVLFLFTFIRAFAIKDKKKLNSFIKPVVATFFIIDALLFAINPIKELMIHYSYIGGNLAVFTYIQQPLYWIHLVFVYTLFGVIVYHLVKRFAAVPYEYKMQYLLAVLTVMIVILLNALFPVYMRLFGRNGLDYSIWGYSLAVTYIYLICFRYPVVGMKSYYHEWIVENVNQGIVLFNYEGNLIIHNDKVHSIFPDAKIESGMDIEEFSNQLKFEIKEERNNSDYSFQHYVTRGDKEFPIRFDHRSLKNDKGQNIGHLYIFTDGESDVDLLTSFYTWENFKQLLKDSPQNFSTPLVVSVCDINGLSDINIKMGRNVGDHAIQYLANVMRKNFQGESYYIRGQEACLIVLSFDIDEKQAKENLAKVHEELLTVNQLGFIINIQSAVGVVKNKRQSVLHVVKQTIKGMKNKKLLDVKSHRSELVTSLVKTLAECDNDTEAHVKRTQSMGAELGKRLGLSDIQQSDLALLCILHDIGKIGIPLDILNKPSKLSDSEWRMMKTHTEKGYQIATSSQELSHIADMILHHHESWDGRGYPDGLSKESIPLLSRIIAVVDSYDAMINTRPYRVGMPVEDAIKELKKCAGTQFDPSIVNEFIRMLPEFENIEDTEELEILSVIPSSESESTSESETASKAPAKSNVHEVIYTRYFLDDKLRIINTDDQFEKLTGYTKEDVEKNVITQFDLIPEDDRVEYMRVVNEQSSQKDVLYFEHRVKRKDNSIVFVFCYGKNYYDSAEKANRTEVIVFESANTYAMQIMLSEEQNKADIRLAKWEDKYRCDSLTGLLNHEAFKNDVEMKMLEGHTKTMLLMMDVDKFKQYNDTYGHKEGDEFLIKFAQTLSATLRKDDLACRMGGDEYSAALFYRDDTVSDEKMIERAQQIFDKISLILTTQKGGTSLSMGLVISDENTKTFNELYEKADKALYHSKEHGRARMSIYDSIDDSEK